MRQKRKNKIIIFSLLGLLCIMTVGYAAFQTNLNIKGTSSISSNWDIIISNIEKVSYGGEAEEAKVPAGIGTLMADMEVNLYQKGDFIEYDVTVLNRGTIDAVLSNIRPSEREYIDPNNEAIKISFGGVSINDKLYKGDTHHLKVRLEYNPDFTGTPKEGSVSLEIGLEYTQAEIAGTPTLNPNLYVSNKGDDTKGNGSKSNPYLTIAKAYSEASDGSTIYIMDDITQTETLNLNEDKNITITSDGTRHSIIRGNNFTGHLINAQTGQININNIILDGNNVESEAPLIITYIDTNIFGSKLINNNNTYLYATTNDNTKVGGGINKYSGTLTIENSEISNNSSNFGGGIYTFTSDNKLVINNTEISNNYSYSNGNGIGGAGGAILANSPVELNSGKILNNSSQTPGGGIFIKKYSININGNTEIKGNISDWSGAGIYLQGSNCTINDNTFISENETTGPYAGGGITIYDESTLTLNSGTISNNKVNGDSGAGVRVDRSHLILNGGTIIDNSNATVPGSNNIGIGSSALSSVLDKKSEYTVTSKKYFIAPALNNTFVLDVDSAKVANGTNVQLYNGSGNSQKWKVIPYKVVNGVVDYMFLSQIDQTQYIWVNGNSAASGANVVTWGPHNANGGFWRLANQGNGYYQIKNILGMCLNVAGTNAANNTNVQTYTCNNSNAQKWKFIETT